MKTSPLSAIARSPSRSIPNCTKLKSTLAPLCCLPVCSDPVLSEEVETLARQIAGHDADAISLELARQIAEAHFA